jgi:cytochrome bd-type quinol oxidase subunit 2
VDRWSSSSGGDLYCESDQGIDVDILVAEITEKILEQNYQEIGMVYIVAVFIALLGIVILFQLALALGAPWGEYAMGGKFPGKFPAQMRIAALVQIVILFLIALVVLSASGLALNQFYNFARTAIWFVVAFFVLGSLMNLATKSVKERRIWAPVNVLLLLLSIFVAINL